MILSEAKLLSTTHPKKFLFFPLPKKFTGNFLLPFNKTGNHTRGFASVNKDIKKYSLNHPSAFKDLP